MVSVRISLQEVEVHSTLDFFSLLQKEEEEEEEGEQKEKQINKRGRGSWERGVITTQHTTNHAY